MKNGTLWWFAGCPANPKVFESKQCKGMYDNLYSKAEGPIWNEDMDVTPENHFYTKLLLF